MDTNTQPRIFRIGQTVIHEDESTAGLSIPQVAAMLAIQYPEVQNSQVVEQTGENGERIVNFMAKAGKKG